MNKRRLNRAKKKIRKKIVATTAGKPYTGPRITWREMEAVKRASKLDQAGPEDQS